MTGLFGKFYKDSNENSGLHDIADIDKIKDLSDEELIERYNTVMAMGAETYRRLDESAFPLEAMFDYVSEFGKEDPDGTDHVVGKELRDAGLTQKQCLAFYDSILKPYVLDVEFRFIEDIKAYRDALGQELAKRQLLSLGETLWYNFGDAEESNWSNMGTLIRRKKE